MDCVKCGAPLPPKSNVCTYCGALNDTDLRAIHRDAKKGPETDRICPQCAIKLETIDLGIEGKFYIERCDKCLGIFFDPGELEALIDKSVSNVYQVDHQRMVALIEEEGVSDFVSVRYAKCPVCHDLMNRKSYGSRSGVIADVCKEHGVWLTGGELGQLLKWVKAGGRIYDDRRKAEEERRQELSRKKRKPKLVDYDQLAWGPESSSCSDTELFKGILGFIVRLMR